MAGSQAGAIRQSGWHMAPSRLDSTPKLGGMGMGVLKSTLLDTLAAQTCRLA